MSDESVGKPPRGRGAAIGAFVVGFLAGGVGVYFAGDQAHDRLQASYRKLQDENRSLLKELGRGDPPPAAQ